MIETLVAAIAAYLGGDLLALVGKAVGVSMFGAKAKRARAIAKNAHGIITVLRKAREVLSGDDKAHADSLLKRIGDRFDGDDEPKPAAAAKAGTDNAATVK